VTQLRLERWIIDYENYRVKELIDNNEIDQSTESKIYTNIFRIFEREWKLILSEFTINNYRKMKRYNLIDKENIVNNLKFMCVFILISMGSLNVFSLVFKKVLDSVYREGGVKHNELVMRIGEYVTSSFYRNLIREIAMSFPKDSESESIYHDKKFVEDLSNDDSWYGGAVRVTPPAQENKYNKNKWSVNPIELYSLINKVNKENINKDKLVSMFTNISEELKAEIGTSLMFFIKLSCKELIINKVVEDNKTYLYVNFDKSFYNEVYAQSINTFFLPMICRPLIWSKEKVGGYLTVYMRAFANPDESIIKHNPKVIKNSKISKKQIDCINYMNNVPFKINSFVLNYLLLEWDKENSKLFKGFNKLHPNSNLLIEKKKTQEIESKLYKEIQSHNSIYHHNYNTLMMASLYRNQVFYIPTFLDFRGRLYTKVTYLSYQGGDMARSLLEFYRDDYNIKNRVNKDRF